MSNIIFTQALERFQSAEHFRIVLFGASNTERYMPGIHWSDVLETSMRMKFGRKFQIINSGVSGNNTRHALNRFDRDVALFQPDLVIVTFGGNDREQEAKDRYIPEEEYRENLRQIVRKIHALGALCVLQTYYKMDLEAMEKPYAERFVRNMQIVRELAEEESCHLVDQYALFDKVDPLIHRYKLMLNPCHTNENGNILIGLELLRHFDLSAEKIAHNEKIIPWVQVHEKALQALS